MSRTRWHLLFLFCGLATAVTLGIHMAAQHLNNLLSRASPDPTSWVSMISRATEKSWVAIYILILAFVLYHALYGLRGILLEVITSGGAVRLLNWILIVGGIVVFGWGSYVLVVLFDK